MDNDAFKDLVRKKASIQSTKEIARKAVEEEFKKKKKRKRGGGDDDYSSSSSDDDDDHKGSKQRRKQTDNKKDDDDDGDDDDDAKRVQEDLAARYRDRAKDRRENNSEKAQDFLIIPHNKIGLDLAQLRKERQIIQKEEETNSNSAQSSSGGITNRSKIPSTIEEALETIRESVASSSPGSLSRGLVEYLREFVEWGEI